MELKHLYIENFACHSYSFIDFTKFNSALIVGKKDNNELFSNGVGKSTIFKSIEYVLFNQADVNLEEIIKDDCNYTRVTLDFIVDGEEYRVSRKRTKKGSTDLSLFIKQNVENFQYFSGENKPIFDEKYWKDISGSRASDIEKNLNNLIKINFKSFRSTVHFMQNDFSGLASLPTEKRKSIFKEALSLATYSKLEKIAKDKMNLISKEIDKTRTLISVIGDPNKDIDDFKINLNKFSESKLQNDKLLIDLEDKINKQNENILSLKSELSSVTNLLSSNILKIKNISDNIKKTESYINDISAKKNLAKQSAKSIVSEIDALKKEYESLNVDYLEIDKLKELINKKEIEAQKLSFEIKIVKDKIKNLEKPLPEGSVCDSCYQTMTDEHRQKCIKEINKEIILYKEKDKNILSALKEANIQLNDLSKKRSELILNKDKFDKISGKIDLKIKELSDKKTIYNDYSELFNSEILKLNSLKEELLLLESDLDKSSASEKDRLINAISNEESILRDLKIDYSNISNQNSKILSNIAIYEDSILRKQNDLKNLEDLNKKCIQLESDYKTYPDVVQAFSSTGIPNLIIQNVLDDLQIESNNLLGQLKPGLQLSFFVEKIKDDGTESDTLDIKYFLNGRERKYEQLSGAQKLSVTFSLKLGLYFLLQKLIGIDLKFLLLDEIDQSLDKGSVDAFADIIKFFQKDFTILVITHNDRLKDKFKDIILVSQDLSDNSSAQLMSNW